MIKKALRRIVPFSARHCIWSFVPSFFRINTLVRRNLSYQSRRSELPVRYSMREISNSDIEALKAFYNQVSPTAFRRKIPKRLSSVNCRGYSIFENDSGVIVYCNWLIHGYTAYLREFGIDVLEPMIFWDSAYCLPDHRHQGFHEIMEQELINYCVTNGVPYFYMQIHSSNEKGNLYAMSKGYNLINTRHAIYWPVFDIYRSLTAFLLHPLKRIHI